MRTFFCNRSYFLKLRCVLLLTSVWCHLTLNVNSQIPNADFENWSPLVNPEDWETNSCFPCVGGWKYVVEKDSQVVYHGQYSAKLIYNDSYPFYGHEGDSYLTFAPAWVRANFSITVHPTALKAFIKCDLFGPDTTIIRIRLLSNGLVVDSGRWVNTSSFGTWTEIIIPISNSTSIVDSAIVTIFGGLEQSGNDPNTKFWVDYLSFEFNNAVEDINDSEVLEVFPNPFGSHLNVQLKRKDITSIKLVSIVGNDVSVLSEERIEFGELNLVFDTQHLGAGFYILEVATGSSTQFFKVLKK